MKQFWRKKRYQDRIMRKKWSNNTSTLELSSHENSNNGKFQTCISTQSKEVSNKTHDNENVRILDNGILEVGLEWIRIHHSNPNYNKEMKEFEKQLGDIALTI